MGSARELYYGGLAVAAGYYGYGLIDAVTGPARFYAFMPGRQRGLGVGAEFRF
jgi:hypothetical protein